MSSTGAISWVTEATQQKRTVKTLYRMSGSLAYGSNGQLFDIAIIEVNTPFTMNAKVVAAKLPTARTAAGTSLIVSGWGTTTEGNSRNVALLVWNIEHLWLTKGTNFRWSDLMHLEASSCPSCHQSWVQLLLWIHQVFSGLRWFQGWRKGLLPGI